MAYALTGPKWGASATDGTPGGTVTYAFDTSVPADWYNDINVSFGAWSVYGDIQFQNVALNQNPNIIIKQEAIDGAGKTLAEARASYVSPDGTPRDGQFTSVQIVFDSAEGWGPGLGGSGHVEADSGARLDIVSTHEVGHAIGLNHDTGTNGPAIMDPVYNANVTTLRQNDIDGVRALYGVACYCTGSLIRTVDGEVAVEDLRIGDRVVTASGAHRPIKWIGTRAYAGRFANANPNHLPVCFKAGSLAEGVPARDLWVSPKHAMFLDRVLIPAEHLVNGASVVQAERVESVEYWHVELDSHDVLIAEGAASESYVDDENRGMFRNAHEYGALYPEAQRAEAKYCAPRVEDGHVLEAVRRRLAERAGLPVTTAARFGTLRGAVEARDCFVTGWAQDAAYPDAPVCLDVIVDGVLAARTYAAEFRPDLLAAGIGDGCHGFAVRLPASLSRGDVHVIELRRSGDGVLLGATIEVPASQALAA